MKGQCEDELDSLVVSQELVSFVVDEISERNL